MFHVELSINRDIPPFFYYDEITVCILCLITHNVIKCPEDYFLSNSGVLISGVYSLNLKFQLRSFELVTCRQCNFPNVLLLVGRS